MTDYRDCDGNPVTLDKLCRDEPAWAANVIRQHVDRIAEREAADADAGMGALLRLRRRCAAKARAGDANAEFYGDMANELAAEAQRLKDMVEVRP